MTPRLSIIIPVYNTAVYIDRCLESIQRIPLKEIEVITVNDGSTDDSLEKLKQWKDKFPLMHIIEQPNGGLSVARNNGMSVATGDYIWFIDSDDWIDPGKVLECLELAESNQLDLISFGIVLSDGNSVLRDLALSGVENDDIVFTGRDYYLHNYVHASACVAFYRREFLLEKQFRFLQGVLSEDQEFTPRVYFLAERVMYHRQCLYFYYQRPGSIQKSITPKKFWDFLHIARSLRDFADKNFKNDFNAYDCLLNQVAFCVSQALAHYSKGSSGHSLESVLQSGVYPVRVSQKVPFKTRLKYRIMNISLVLYIFLRRLIAA